MGEPVTKTAKANLLAYKESGGYTVLVFENLEGHDQLEKYFWMSIPPGWKDVNLKVGETYIVNFIAARAGDKYYDKDYDLFFSYKTTMNWYKNSILLNYNINKNLILD